MVPRKRAAATRRAPPTVRLRPPPSTGRTKTKTISDPAIPMMSVARMMLRMYCALLNGPISICSNIPFFRSNQSCVPALVPPFMTVSVTAPAARKRG